MHVMYASRSLCKVYSELEIESVMASCTIEVAFVFQFQYYIWKHLYGKFGWSGIHGIMIRWPRDRNMWKHDRSFGTYPTCVTLKLFSLPSLSFNLPVYKYTWPYMAQMHACFSGTLRASNCITFIMHLYRNHYWSWRDSKELVWCSQRVKHDVNVASDVT